MLRLLMKLMGSMVLTFVATGAAFACNISNENAIASAKLFCKKLGIKYSHEPWVSRTDYVWRIKNSEVKRIEFGEKGDYKISMDVNCINQEVVGFFNWEHDERLRKIHKISSITTEPHNWPSFLSEKKAKEILLAYAKRIELPPDVEFAAMVTDKDRGVINGRWIRKKKGYTYEKDAIEIEIMAVDGEIFSYSKHYYGKVCPLELKVRKEEAVKEGWKQIEKLFNKVDWKRHKKSYDIKSAELKIVQPNFLDGQITKMYSPESRLAWVLHYGLRDRPDRKKLAEISYLQSITMKVDAGTIKLLGVAYSQ
ncbi:MAG: hypothetical protein HXX17_03840 [Geobacteraceae bacterium]|nr:hypothetical protein [Geobacteraceae bacterium]